MKSFCGDAMIISSSYLYCGVSYTGKSAGLDLNFQAHLSRRTSDIENLPVLHEMTPVRTIIYDTIFLIIDLSCRTSVIIIQPVRGAIFLNFYLSGTVGQSLRSSPGWYLCIETTLRKSEWLWNFYFLVQKEGACPCPDVVLLKTAVHYVMSSVELQSEMETCATHTRVLTTHSFPCFWECPAH